MKRIKILQRIHEVESSEDDFRGVAIARIHKRVNRWLTVHTANDAVLKKGYNLVREFKSSPNDRAFFKRHRALNERSPLWVQVSTKRLSAANASCNKLVGKENRE